MGREIILPKSVRVFKRATETQLYVTDRVLEMGTCVNVGPECTMSYNRRDQPVVPLLDQEGESFLLVEQMALPPKKAYRENVSRLAAKLGVSNDPSLREEDLHVSSLTFYDTDGSFTKIPGTDMNRGSRLFFENLATTDAGGHEIVLRCDEDLMAKAAEYFAELWEDPERGKRQLLDALRTAEVVTIHWKAATHIPADA